MKLLLISLIAIGITSCTTKHKFNRIADKHEDWLSERCSSQYPVKDSLIQGKTDTIVKESIRVDTVTTTITNTVTGKKEIVKLPCPPCKETIKTVARVDTVIMRDTAKERVLELKYIKEHDALIKAETKLAEAKNTLKWIYMIAGVLVVLFGVLKFMRVL